MGHESELYIITVIYNVSSILNMHFTHTHTHSLLLLSATSLAAPFSPHRRATTSTSQSPIPTPKPLESTNWAGAALSGTSISSVSGTFVVPSLSAPPLISTSSPNDGGIWLGIDGTSSCPTILQTGIQFVYSPNGTANSYNAWYEWYPLPAVYFPHSAIDFAPGDEVRLAVQAGRTNTSGLAVVENVTRNMTVRHEFVGQPRALCGKSAEWIVEDHGPTGERHENFPGFGTVVFNGARAEGVFGVEGAGAVDMLGLTADNKTTVAVAGSVTGPGQVTITRN
ncbi:concanavalin A-like lectin/glucanase [Myriangium duriaei CBS 260.36]|uniref:Concanavalin A-like lectin/glucanase n=1 Tax=Myriangium duriaei CBS 260.36 TaxID=1168546 RepID=A0A9P4J3Q2_9PEZI|nr:concanavalin A-like lectin/glucanase [Myriangium duriaei CBS 260.36]